jgi:hypothetical protein
MRANRLRFKRYGGKGYGFAGVATNSLVFFIDGRYLYLCLYSIINVTCNRPLYVYNSGSIHKGYLFHGD